MYYDPEGYIKQNKHDKNWSHQHYVEWNKLDIQNYIFYDYRQKIKLVHGENFLDSGYFGNRDSCLEMYSNRAFRVLVIFNF